MGGDPAPEGQDALTRLELGGELTSEQAQALIALSETQPLTERQWVIVKTAYTQDKLSKAVLLRLLKGAKGTLGSLTERAAMALSEFWSWLKRGGDSIAESMKDLWAGLKGKLANAGQQSATESALNTVKTAGTAFQAGLGIAAGAEDLGASHLKSTDTLVGAETGVEKLGQAYAQQGRALAQGGIKEGAQEAASGIKSGIHAVDPSGGGGGGSGSSGFSSVLSWLKGAVASGVTAIRDGIAWFVSEVLMPGLKWFIDHFGLNVALLIKTLSDVKDKKALFDELKKQKIALDKGGAPTNAALAKAVIHGFGKVRRSMIALVAKLIAQILGIVGRVITLVSGGTAAIVGESLGLLGKANTLITGAFRTAKGVFKYFRGTKGKARAQSAATLLDEAAKGEANAVKIIWSMDLWGKTQKAKGVKGKDTRAANVILEKLSNQKKAKNQAGFGGTLKDDYGTATTKVQAVVKEKVASNLKS